MTTQNVEETRAPTAPSGRRPEHAPIRHRFWLLALFIGAFVVSCTEFVPVGLLPQIADDMGVSESAAGQLVTLNAVAFAIGAPVLGAAFTRFDRRNLLLGTVAVFAAGHVMAGIAPNFGVLLVSRLLSGAMMGLYLATAIAIAANLAAPGRQATSMATIVAGVSTATALGVPVSTLLGQFTGWRVPMFGISLLAVLAIGLIALTVAKSGRDDGPPLRTRLVALGNRPVLIGLGAIMVFWAASFAVYTYVVPLLESRAGVHGAWVTVVLFLAGLGAVGGNMIGGRGADSRLRTTLLLTVLITTIALWVALPASTAPVSAIVLIGIWQLAAWSFVPAVQAGLFKAAGPGGDLAVSFAVSGFNIGIVAGAGLGGVALDAGGLESVMVLGGTLAVIALGLVIVLIRQPGLRELGRAETSGPAEHDGREVNPEPDAALFDGARFDAVLFDMDGTLIDSTRAVERAWARWAEEHGISQEALQRSKGRPAKEIVADLLPLEHAENALARYERIATTDLDGVVVLPGASAALASTRGRMAIVTSSTRNVTMARLAAAELVEPDALVTADDITHGKPAPDPFLLAARRLGLDPSRCLAVEDAAHGVTSARAAGCATLGIGDGDLGADVQVADLSEVSFQRESDSVVLRVQRSAPVASQAVPA